MYSPTLDEFLKVAAQGNRIPVTRRILADFETPLPAGRKIRGPGGAACSGSGSRLRVIHGLSFRLGRLVPAACGVRAEPAQVNMPWTGNIS